MNRYPTAEARLAYQGPDRRGLLRWIARLAVRHRIMVENAAGITMAQGAGIIALLRGAPEDLAKARDTIQGERLGPNESVQFTMLDPDAATPTTEAVVPYPTRIQVRGADVSAVLEVLTDIIYERGGSLIEHRSGVIRSQHGRRPSYQTRMWVLFPVGHDHRALEEELTRIGRERGWHSVEVAEDPGR